MRKLFFVALAASGAIAAPAMAQTTGGPFTGPRAGVVLGYDILQPGDAPNSDIRNDHTADGFLYGGDIGYDIGLGGRYTLGIDGEVSGSTASATNSPRDTSNFGYGQVDAGRDLYIGARAGYIVSPKTLVYIKGGYTNQRLDLTANNGTNDYGAHYNLDGWRLGAGIEESLTPRTYAKLEYRYSNYSDARFEYPDGANTNNFDVNTDRHQIVAGVGFRF